MHSLCSRLLPTLDHTVREAVASNGNSDDGSGFRTKAITSDSIHILAPHVDYPSLFLPAFHSDSNVVFCIS
jgi:hypothetical protein